jgi:hypothetical protein
MLHRERVKVNCTFHPELSKNTKKITENLPSFYQRLELNKAGNKAKATTNQRKENTQHNPTKQHRIKTQLRKEVYTIEGFDELPDKKTEKKVKKEEIPIHHERTIDISEFVNNNQLQSEEIRE